jgi:hypothetical protein
VESGEGRSKAEIITHNSEKEDYFKELESLAKDLEFEPVLRKLLLSNIHATIDSIPSGELILNLCDGCDIDGVPGPSVGRLQISSNLKNEQNFECQINSPQNGLI